MEFITIISHFREVISKYKIKYEKKIEILNLERKKKTATNAQEKVIEGKRENFRWLVVKNSTTIFQNYQTIIILQIKKLSEIVKYCSKSGALRN